ncbi:hypothetical protein GCM10011611_04390 [Aliidongia dinghuensis]|uniref:SnoaL-like domain-containing protein n=1 Tax=Aliidongia dinghuensis TaxID=1867774 RepID=A0A8J2YQ14_9PROT|nr:nuclear transport factor 2 family protein [Aliidongia dinghuensis]GGF02007.1 hypothetical protein GCM10011611_04390 [Aliidongia dinghuensis]
MANKSLPFIMYPICFVMGFLLPDIANAGGAPIETVQHKFDAFNRHDADAIEGAYAVDATLHSPDDPNLSGNKPIADTYRKLFAAIPDAKDNITLIESVGPHVYVQFSLTGHWGGAEDKPIVARLMSVYTVKNGHIAEDDTYYDRKI